METFKPHFTSFQGINTEMQSWIQLQQLGMEVGQNFNHRNGVAESPRDAVLSNKIISAALGML